MVLASGWRALMRCCQPVLPTPKATASDHQAQVPSFVGRVDEGEFNLEWKTATNDRVGCRRTTRDNTVCHQAMHLGDTCATPTAATEDIGSECDWTADDAAVVPSLWSGFDDEALMLQSTSAVTDPLACRSSGCESATRFRPLLLSDLLSAESSDEIDLELAMDPYEPVVLSLSLSQIDEEEISTETKSLCGCGQQRVCTPRVATTPENGAHDTRYLCWTPTPRSEEFDSESENGPCEAAAVPWSFSQTNEQRLYTSRTTPRDHRVTRQRTSRGRLFPSKAQLLSDLRLTLIEAIDQMDSRSAIVTGITGVDSSCFSRVEDGEVDFEDNGNCRVACPRRQHPRRRRRGRGRRRPIPCYTAEVEQVVHLPKDESTVDEITGIPYFIEDVNIEDICFYRVTANNRRVAHAQTPRERNILKNFLSNAMRHMLPPSVEDFYAMPTQITNGVRINGGPSILARGDEDEPEDQKALQDANSISPGRATPGRKLRRKQAGTEKRCTYRVILRHQEIIVSSESEEDYDGPLSPVSEEASMIRFCHSPSKQNRTTQLHQDPRETPAIFPVPSQCPRKPTKRRKTSTQTFVVCAASLLHVPRTAERPTRSLPPRRVSVPLRQSSKETVTRRIRRGPKKTSMIRFCHSPSKQNRTTQLHQDPRETPAIFPVPSQCPRKPTKRRKTSTQTFVVCAASLLHVPRTAERPTRSLPPRRVSVPLRQSSKETVTRRIRRGPKKTSMIRFCHSPSK
ncbi:hypothetical protein TGVEG_316780, partial [Toxoplasma gondii VEG]